MEANKTKAQTHMLPIEDEGKIASHKDSRGTEEISNKEDLLGFTIDNIGIIDWIEENL
jgi:hypothetical protein|tara:strand:+ start:1160 stop:1333 length:174 start_codon:yes stop_codon:yes gene_type:complete